jgi:hypothetical protein
MVVGQFEGPQRVESRVRRETGKEQVVQVHYDEGIANHIGPEPCVGVREDTGEASVGDRIGQPLSRESHVKSGADTVLLVEGNTAGGAIASTRTARRGRRPGMCGRSLRGNREISGLARGEIRWSASGRRGVEADDARTREV